VAEPALRDALRRPLPLENKQRIEAILEKMPRSPPGAWAGTLRALDVLELIGTADACRLLEELSEGLSGSPQTQEAQRSLRRLNDRLAAESK
jgi:hypothetical protein